MHKEGHAGFTLFLFSLLMMPFGNNFKAQVIIILSTGLSALPDFDLNWEIKHRGITHTLLFAIFIGIGFGILFYYVYQEAIWFIAGFLSGFGGVMSHIIGDLFNYTGFRAFYPISKKSYAWKKFESGNKAMNRFFGGIGAVTFILYLMITTGTLQALL